MAEHHMSDALLNDLSLLHFQSLFKVILFWLVEYSCLENDVVISHMFLLCPQPAETHTALTHFDIKTVVFIQEERMASVSVP